MLSEVHVFSSRQYIDVIIDFFCLHIDPKIFLFSAPCSLSDTRVLRISSFLTECVALSSSWLSQAVCGIR